MTATLREQMKVDAGAVLNCQEFGESAIWSSSTASKRLDVHVVEQGERQQVRRASLFTRYESARAIAPGDTFAIKRAHSATDTYVVLYSDKQATALQRHICHERLTDLFRIVTRDVYKGLRGEDAWGQSEDSATIRGKLILSDAENVRSTNRRKLRSSFRLIFETLPTLTTDMIAIDASGRGYRITRVERPSERVDLPYADVSYSDA